MKPSSAPPPSSFGVKPSAAPLCDRSEVEHEPSVKVVEGEVDAIPESPVESLADIPEEGGHWSRFILPKMMVRKRLDR